MPQTTSRLRSLLLGPSASRGTDLGLLIVRLGFGLTLGLALAGSASTLESYHQAEAQVRRGLDALGGPGALAEAGGLSIEGEGWLDLSTRMQGAHPDRPERVPATRLLASVRILDVGENPHAEGMLVVHLPAEGILYQADLFVPSGGHFPDPARLPVMRWFVDWLDSSGLDPREVWAVHGSARVTDEQLDRIRSGEAARPAASSGTRDDGGEGSP